MLKVLNGTWDMGQWDKFLSKTSINIEKTIFAHFTTLELYHFQFVNPYIDLVFFHTKIVDAKRDFFLISLTVFVYC